eukprot:GILI01003568.1.p1 GENE.GILI01003568.1~~GILI01003568.1.p1  ORF type:complete len:704 (-),score=237.71 GILI01003568.1:116-2227(-)
MRRVTLLLCLLVASAILVSAKETLSSEETRLRKHRSSSHAKKSSHKAQYDPSVVVPEVEKDPMEGRPNPPSVVYPTLHAYTTPNGEDGQAAGDSDAFAPMITQPPCNSTAADLGLPEDTPCLDNNTCPELPPACPAQSAGYAGGPLMPLPFKGDDRYQACPPGEPGYLGGPPLPPPPSCLPPRTPGYCGGLPLPPPPIGIPMGSPGYCGGLAPQCPPVPLKNVIPSRPEKSTLVVLQPKLPQDKAQVTPVYKHCVLKKGWLALAEKSSTDYGRTPRTVVARPVVAVLNLQTLSVFGNDNINEARLAINLKQLSPVTDYHNETGCFEVAYENSEKTYTLCAEDSVELIAWVKAINDFKLHCKNPDDDKTEYVKQQIKVMLPALEKQKALEQEEQAIINDEFKASLKTKKSLDKIEQNLQARLHALQYEESIEEVALRHKVAQQKALLKEQAQKAHEQEQCLKQQMNLKLEAEKKVVLDIEHKAEIEEKEKAAQRLIEAAQKELNERLKHQREEAAEAIRLEQKKVEKEKARAMQEVLDGEGVRDYQGCLVKDLFPNGEASPDVNAICEQAYPPIQFGTALAPDDEMDKCVDVKTFCDSCCRGFIGYTKAQLIHDCVSQCQKNNPASRGEPGKPVSPSSTGGQELSALEAADPSNSISTENGRWVYVPGESGTHGATGPDATGAEQPTAEGDDEAGITEDANKSQ